MPVQTPQGFCPGCLLKWGLKSQYGNDEDGIPLASDLSASPTPDELATHFPDLEIIELIGRGGMGVVYKVRQKHLNRLAALKILAPKVRQDPAFAERFAREARAMAMLNHPHIVAVYDFGRADDFYYFLMEYVDGMHLRRLLESGKFAPEEALAIVPQICEALQFAHDRGVVHRDIKPENLLLDTKGQIKIADFGIAKWIGRDTKEITLTCAGQVVGTPQYMAPEQIERPLEVDHRADIYSLGVVFYQMLTGELPIGRFAPPSKRVQVDVRLDEVVLRALEKEPERRFQRVSELKTEVETISTTPYAEKKNAPPRFNILKAAQPWLGLLALSLFLAGFLLPLFVQPLRVENLFFGVNVFVGLFGLLAWKTRCGKIACFLALIYLTIGVGQFAYKTYQNKKAQLASNNPTTQRRQESISTPPRADDAEIKLVGVCPDVGDDLFDAQGNRLDQEKSPAVPLNASRPEYWGPDSFACTLIFDIPQNLDLVWARFPAIRVSGTNRTLGATLYEESTEACGQNRRFLTFVVKRTYEENGWLGKSLLPIESINVTLKYYLPGREKAVCTFQGPFELEKNLDCQENLACRLTPRSATASERRGVKFHLSGHDLPVVGDLSKLILVYDIEGKKHLARFQGGSAGDNGRRSALEADYLVDTLSWSRIAAITLGEIPREKTFSGIRVRYPGRLPRDYAPYLDKMAAALGLTALSGEQLAQYQFKNPEEALKVIDTVRGIHIRQAWNAIQNDDFANLPEDAREKRRRTAQRWAENGLECGIAMGLKGNCPEFVAPAFDSLASNSGNRFDIARAMQRYTNFTPQDLEHLAVLLEQRRDPRGLCELLDCLRRNRQRPGGQEALLRLARSNRTWLWWPVLKNLTEYGGLTIGQLTRDLQVKYWAQSNPDLALDPLLAEDARTLLIQLPTAKLAAMSTGTLYEVIQSISANLPREKAQQALLDLVQQIVDSEEDYSYEDYASNAWQPVDCAVRHLNKWNNMNLGGIGADLSNETSSSERIDWPALAKETLTHFGRKIEKKSPGQSKIIRPSETRANRFTLVDALNKPIPNATLDLLARTRNESGLRDGLELYLKTDDQGRFTIDLPAGNAIQTISGFSGKVFHPEYGAAPVIVYGDLSPVETPLVKKDTPSYERALKGQVVNAAGQPVAGG